MLYTTKLLLILLLLMLFNFKNYTKLLLYKIEETKRMAKQLHNQENINERM